MPALHQEGGLRLGTWVTYQRVTKNSLTADQQSRLNALGFIWDRLAAQWEANFAALEKFYRRERHCRVPAEHKEDGLRIGGWVKKQRLRRDSLTADQQSRLNTLGFIWDRRAAQWEANFAALEKFYRREGHCRVPAKHKEDGLRIGGWVNKQRERGDSRTADQQSRLSALGFVWKA